MYKNILYKYTGSGLLEFIMPKTNAFDRYTDEYDDWFAKNPEKYEAELELIRELLPPQAAALGCFPGRPRT